MKTKPAKNNEEDEKKKGRQRFWAMIMIIILLLSLFLIFRCQVEERNDRFAEEARRLAYELAIEKAYKTADSIEKAIADSIAKADSILKSDSLASEDEPKAKQSKPSILISSSSAIASSSSQKVDTIPPVASILPPPGRYYKPINIRIECGEPKCETEIYIDDPQNILEGKIENYNKTGKVHFRAIDSAGNASSWEAAAYDMASDNNCAGDSYPVPVKGKTVCVDAYEFPNKAGEKPRNMVSQEAASRLCESAGKKLCSVEEWQAACRGNSNSRYPYGNSYNQRKCATDLKTAKEPNRSGFAEHCRSYYGMYDMSGNLWEWTSTHAEREGLFLVAGGAWNTQNASSCSETKFSFYPQNEYPFVGFRCCK